MVFQAGIPSRISPNGTRYLRVTRHPYDPAKGSGGCFEFPEQWLVRPKFIAGNPVCLGQGEPAGPRVFRVVRVQLDPSMTMPTYDLRVEREGAIPVELFGVSEDRLDNPPWEPSAHPRVEAAPDSLKQHNEELVSLLEEIVRLEDRRPSLPHALFNRITAALRKA
jgi:hypothetical protein